MEGQMKNESTLRKSLLAVALSCAGILAAGAAPSFAKDMALTLAGDQEVPPVTTTASGAGTISVNDDKSVSGSIMTKDVNGVAAHIHEGAPGKNGPVIVPLTKTGDAGWSVPSGAKLTDEQYASYKAGNLYVNVHSPANKAGEIRGQITP
jgi:hypothetical protein